MVEEMNTILSDQTWWNASKRIEAELRFSKAVVDAFYDEIQAGKEESEVLRERFIHLPDSKNDDYCRVLFVGTTGAGKTSVLRQLIGSDPISDRFPSTAPAKTTIADIEVIQASGNYEAAVTFFSEFQTLANIEECILDAANAAREKVSLRKIADRFLNHRDQKFRLSYVLGTWNQGDKSIEEDDEISFDETEDFHPSEEDEIVTEAERAAYRAKLQRYLDRIIELSQATIEELREELGLNFNMNEGDRDAALELVEESFEGRLMQDESFHELVQDVLEDVKERFSFVAKGQLQLRQSGWPELWQFRSDDRTEFIDQIRWFSSNYWPHFGKLLTPLVDGIRIRGPLFPIFSEGPSRIVYIDGQGLGHTPDSTSSVTTRITKRFRQVDVILLVDNAEQPMQAAPMSVLRAVASSGHQDKLGIVFTRLDQIKGLNLPTFPAKRAHVMASVFNALASLRDALGAGVVDSIEQHLDSRCFMLGGVDRPLNKMPDKAASYMKDRFRDLIHFFEEAILPPPLPKGSPIYDPTGVGFAVQEAVSKFQGPWSARLGLKTYDGFNKEHWTRVKALNRRIAGELDDEYDTLRPVADMVTQLRESLSRFLNNPFSWTHEPGAEEDKQAAIANVRQSLDLALHQLAVTRLLERHLDKWRAAHDGLSGAGSTYLRALAIHGIYDAAAPLPDAVMTQESAKFLKEIRDIVTSAIEENGGRVELPGPSK
jgi:DNA-binding transcriptional regulator YiaG